MAQQTVLLEGIVKLPGSKSPIHGAAGAASISHSSSVSSSPRNTKNFGRTSTGAPSIPPHAVSCAVAAPRNEGFIFGGKRDGDVVSWQLFASRSQPSSSAPPSGSTSKSGSSRNLQNSPSAAEPAAAAIQAKLTVLGSHKGAVTCVAYYPARKLLFSGSVDASVCVWDPLQVYQKTNGGANGYRLQLLNAHDGTVTHVAIHCNVLVTGSVDKTVKIWGFDERREGLAVPMMIAKQAFVFDNWITTIYASMTKTTEVQQEDIFVGDASGNITSLHSIMAPCLQKNAVEDTGVLHVELVRHQKLSDTNVPPGASNEAVPKSISAILPLPNVNSLVTLGFESYALITDATKGTVLGKIEHPDGGHATSLKHAPSRFVDILFFPGREEMVLLDNHGSLLLWETRTNQFLAIRKANHAASKSTARSLVAFSATGFGQQPSYLRAADEYFCVVHDDGVELVNILRITSVAEVKGHEGRILAVCMNPLSEYVCSGGGLGTTLTASGDSDTADELDVTSSGALSASGIASESLQDVVFVTCGVDNKICFWSSRMSLLRHMTEKYSEISSLCFAGDLDFCATGHDNGSIKFWGLGRDRSIRFTAHDNTISCIGQGYHRYEKRQDKVIPWRHFFTISYDGCLALWDVPVENSKPKCEGRVRVSNSELVCAVYDSMKYAYIIGDNNGCVSIWSVDELKPIRNLQHVSRVAPSPSSAFSRHSAVVVNTHRRPAHKEAATSISLDGNLAVSAGEDKMIFMWNTLTGECVKELLTSTSLYRETIGGSQDDDGESEPRFGEVQQLCVHPTTGDIFACTRNGTVICFNQASGEATLFYKAAAEVSAMCLNPLNNEVVMGLDNGNVLRTPIAMFRPLTMATTNTNDEHQGADDDTVDEVS